MKTIRLASLLFAFGLGAQPTINHKFTEFGILSYPTTKMQPTVVVKNVPRMDNVKVGSALTLYKAGSDSFVIKPERPHTLSTKNGVLVKISPLSFRHKDTKLAKGEVRVEITYLVDKLQFAASGLGLKYYDSLGKGSYMEPKCIFQVRAFQGEEKLYLDGQKAIKIDIPTRSISGQSLYHMDYEDGRWKYYIQPSMSATEGEEKKPGQFQLGDLGVFLLGRLLGSQTACLKGTIQDPTSKLGTDIQVISFGADYNLFFSKWAKDGAFQVNVNRNQKVRILVIDENGYYGLSKWIQSPDKFGHTAKQEGKNNFKKDIGIIKINQLPLSKSDTASLKKLLSIPVSKDQ